MAAAAIWRRAPSLRELSGPLRSCTSQVLKANLSSRGLASVPGAKRFLLPSKGKPIWNGDFTKLHFSIYSCRRCAAASKSDYIPAPPEVPVPVDPTEVATEGLNALGEASLASMGLATYSPAGLVRQGLEALHVGLDIPWCGAIAIGALLVRLVLFPLIVTSQKNAALMQIHMPTMSALNDRIKAARNRQDHVEMARLSKEVMDYTKRNKFNPLTTLFPVMLQAPIFLAVFPGLRSMCNYPVDSMQTGGLSWFADLTVADPYYILPAFTAATMLLIVEMGADGMKTQDLAQRTPNLIYFMRAMPVVIFLFTMNFPAGMTCYWCVSNLISLVQSSILKVKPVREYLGIPERVNHPTMKKHPSSSGKGFITDMKESYKSMKVANTIEQRSQINASRYKAAGLAPVQKTFKADPTKGAAKQQPKRQQA